MSYAESRAWSDKWIREIARIVGPFLIVPTTFEQDTKQAADLIVLQGRHMTLAARMRRHGYADKYPDEFTLRYRLDSGTKTEFSKIVDGWGDWFFYGHASEDEFEIERWMLIDLNAFRAHWTREGWRTNRKIAYKDRSNLDGTHFRAFDSTTFIGDPKLIIGQSHPTKHPQLIAA